MMQWAIFIQEGFGSDGQHIFFTKEPPRYEAESIPVFARVADTDETVQVGEREETFVIFTPLNGPSRRRGKPNRVPFQRILSVVEQEGENDDV
jgi:hypothetical protein